MRPECITKANVHCFHTKAEILEAALSPSMARIARLLDEAETIRAKRARARFLVDGGCAVRGGREPR
jgi:hypothetical protein